VTRAWLVALSLLPGLALPAPAAAQVEMTFADGRVSLSATDATLQDVLAEWERTGRTKIFGGDQLAPNRLTLRLEDVPEERALEVLLRSVNGYLAAPRSLATARASRFDRIMILPGTPRPVAAAATRPAPVPESLPPDIPPMGDLPELSESDEPSDAAPPVRVIPAPGRRRPTMFSTFPRVTQPEPADVAPDTVPASPATAPPVYRAQPAPPPGVAVPGMIVPAPQDEENAPEERSGS
jgi:hypothetical protein